MIRLRERIAGEPCEINAVQSKRDYREVMDFASAINPSTGKPFALSFDTESTGLNCHHPDWYLRMFQFGDADVFVVPAEHKELIEDVISIKRRWTCHNAPHDVRSIDAYLGYESKLLPYCRDTFILAHLLDSRNQEEGGTGNRLENLAVAYVDHTITRFERNLKKEFKQIEIPVPGEFYRSGPRKGLPKVRKAKIAEGWKLIPTYNEAYLRYAGSDPLNTKRVERELLKRLRAKQPEFRSLEKFELQVQRACDALQRVGVLVDVEYARKLAEELVFDAEANEDWCEWYGVANINSTQQVSSTMVALGAQLTERTKTGRLKADSTILEKYRGSDTDLGRLVGHILTAKQLRKRKKAYVDSAIDERDASDRVHPTIKSLAARTARMSMSDVPLHQLPSHEKRIRQMFIAGHGWAIFSVDYDQQEMRMAGALSGEEKIIEAARRNFSIHKLTAETVFGKKYSDKEYKFSKNLNFGWLFGGGAATLSRQTGIEYATAADLIKRYSAGYPTLNKWKRNETDAILKSAFTTSEYAMFRHLQRQMWECDDSYAGKLMKREWRAELDDLCAGKYGVAVTPIGRHLIVDANKAYRVVNYKVQAASRDITAEGLVRVLDSKHGKYARLVIHDELLGEGPERKAQRIADAFAELMTMDFYDVPFTASGKVYGRSWGDGYGS